MNLGGSMHPSMPVCQISAKLRSNISTLFEAFIPTEFYFGAVDDKLKPKLNLKFSNSSNTGNLTAFTHHISKKKLSQARNCCCK